MVDRLKKILDNSVVWVGALLVFLFVMFQKNKTLEDKLEAKDGDNKLKELKGEEKIVDSTAGDSLDHYNSLKRQYQQEHPTDGDHS